MGEAGAAAEQLGGEVTLRAQLAAVTAERDDAKRSAAAWEETAAQYARNHEYYRGLVVRCGDVLGPAAHVADDGSSSPDVLVAKVPELVAAVTAENERLREAAAHWEDLYAQQRADHGDALKECRRLREALEQVYNCATASTEFTNGHRPMMRLITSLCEIVEPARHPARAALESTPPADTAPETTHAAEAEWRATQ